MRAGTTRIAECGLLLQYVEDWWDAIDERAFEIWSCETEDAAVVFRFRMPARNKPKTQEIIDRPPRAEILHYLAQHPKLVNSVLSRWSERLLASGSCVPEDTEPETESTVWAGVVAREN